MSKRKPPTAGFTSTLDETEFLRHGACRGQDPEMFFPVGNTSEAAHQSAQAKAVCRSCPVTIRCLTWALETDQAAGVWGGMDESERLNLQRRATTHRTGAAA
jgi:WhiB family redox-sensing transcriptional regulator